MFKQRKPSPGIQQAKLATLVAHDVHIAGDLEFSDGLRMDGHVKGNVTGRAGEQTLLVVSDRVRSPAMSMRMTSSSMARSRAM
jgi:cytoskeletal protein CcmA (bactofilin family)